MNLDQLQRRDRRIADLEAKGDARTIDEEDEYHTLTDRRLAQWKRLPQQLATARRRARELEAYARQSSFPLKRVPRKSA